MFSAPDFHNAAGLTAQVFGANREFSLPDESEKGQKWHEESNFVIWSEPADGCQKWTVADTSSSPSRLLLCRLLKSLSRGRWPSMFVSSGFLNCHLAEFSVKLLKYSKPSRRLGGLLLQLETRAWFAQRITRNFLSGYKTHKMRITSTCHICSQLKFFTKSN